jgi:phosphatidylserine decarboxylase
LGFARHGWAEILLFSLAASAGMCISAALAAALHPFFGFLAVPLLLFWLEILYFFRDPERTIPSDANAIVSPADGVITNIETVDEPDFGPALRISIFLSIFNVHVNRLPRSGAITNIRYFPGAYLDARNPESAKRNEQLWIDMIDSDTGQPMRVKQISGAIARRIVCWLKPGDQVEKGARLGMIKLGSRTDVLLPPDAVQKVEVAIGANVYGGSTILARM